MRHTFDYLDYKNKMHVDVINSFWEPVCETKLGDVLDFGKLFKAFGNN